MTTWTRADGQTMSIYDPESAEALRDEVEARELTPHPLREPELMQAQEGFTAFEGAFLRLGIGDKQHMLRRMAGFLRERVGTDTAKMAADYVDGAL